MKILHILTIILVSTSLACSQNTDTLNHIIENETPKALQDNKINLNEVSYSSKARYDLVDKLFKEALQKDRELKKFYESINQLYVFRNNSLLPYHKYTQTNADYWHSVNTYINQLSDSTLKQTTTASYKKLQEAYQKRIRKHEEAIANINSQTINLNDQALLLKLSVTQAMMLNYQINELPDIEITDEILERYEKLIKKVEELKSL